MKVAFLLQTISLLSIRGALEVNAAKLLEPCNADCDCEGWTRDSSIRCEMRHKPLGKRCYQGKGFDESCENHSECKSQWCEGGVCTRHFAHSPVSGPVTCRYSETVTDIVNGHQPQGNGICPCAHPHEPSLSSAQSMFGSNPSKNTYSNNYGVGSGLDLSSITSGPVRSIRICSGDGPYMRDPTSYKLEGMCKLSANWREIEVGPLKFPRRDDAAFLGTGEYIKECIEVKISAKSFFNKYRITFPTQRGGDPTCFSACRNYPTEFSELSLNGPCAQEEEAPTPGAAAQAAPIPSPTSPAPIPSPTSPICKYELSLRALINGFQPFGSTNCPCAHPHQASFSDAQSMFDSPPSLETYSNSYALDSGLEFTAKTNGPLRTMRICSGEGPYMRDPTSFKLESKCQSASAFNVFQEGPLTFPNREKSVQLGTGAAEKECIEVKIRDSTSCGNEYRITFPTQRGGDATCRLVDSCQNYPTEFSELSFSAPCSQIGEAPTVTEY